MTKSLSKVLMVIPWMVGFLLYGPALILWDQFFPDDEVAAGMCYPAFFRSVTFNLTGSVIDFIVPYFLVSLFNLKLYCNIKKRGRVSPSDNENPAQADSRLKHDRRSARSLGLLTGVYGLTWLPYVISVITNSVGRYQINGDIFDLTCFVMAVNSAINPFIYPVMQHRFRKAFLRIICFFNRLNNNQVNPEV